VILNNLSIRRPYAQSLKVEYWSRV